MSRLGHGQCSVRMIVAQADPDGHRDYQNVGFMDWCIENLEIDVWLEIFSHTTFLTLSCSSLCSGI